MFGKGSRKLETMIGDGTHVEGHLSVKGTIRIDGSIEGDLNADWVVVGENGKIAGNIRSRGVVVGGSVEGNIDAAETVELTGKASMTGEIHAPKLAIAEGARFEGRSRMKSGTEPSEARDGKVRTLIPAKGGTGAN
jgi:cytoskeletal protein CcmA (bactofilin family)